MSRFFKVSIGSIWLTDDGTEGGRPCKVVIPEASALLVADRGNISVGNDGTPFREKPLTPTGGGRPFTILIASVTESVYDSLKSALDTAAGSNAEINVTAEGTPGSIDVDAVVFDNPEYINFDTFGEDYIKGVKISLVTTAIN